MSGPDHPPERRSAEQDIATPAIQGPLYHGFRHPKSDGYQPHDADLVWPLVTDVLQRAV